MASEQERSDPSKRKELDEKARQGEVVVPGGTGGKSLEAQEHLAEGKIKPLFPWLLFCVIVSRVLSVIPHY